MSNTSPDQSTEAVVPEEQVSFPWTDLNEVPITLRVFQDARLSLEQAKEVFDSAVTYGNGNPNQGLGLAWAAFKEKYKIFQDVWRVKNDNSQTEGTAE